MREQDRIKWWFGNRFGHDKIPLNHQDEEDNEKGYVHFPYDSLRPARKTSQKRTNDVVTEAASAQKVPDQDKTGIAAKLAESDLPEARQPEQPVSKPHTAQELPPS